MFGTILVQDFIFNPDKYPRSRHA